MFLAYIKMKNKSKKFCCKQTTTFIDIYRIIENATNCNFYQQSLLIME
ncbi:hypothetical protein I602_580 [Polaribacter dokdonensis DSW-5]|uniref:Uncharacterized protein n=1 Tax=Polaribacter dokdonensis DSW-5 TaxID=1300348 RepID=A0A0N0CEY0_9FLAO|nr:hypothetical protein I602_580 [Polaribacter dokdonensis DSW-5]